MWFKGRKWYRIFLVIPHIFELNGRKPSCLLKIMYSYVIEVADSESDIYFCDKYMITVNTLYYPSKPLF